MDMKTWIEIGIPLNNIICCDCLAGMKLISDDKIDLIITDIPFNVGIDYDITTNDNMDNEEYSDWLYYRIVEMERIVKKGCPIIIFTGDLKIYWVFKAIYRTNLVYHHLLKWFKPSCQRALSGFVLFNRVECAILLTKGKPNQDILNRKVLYEDILIYNNTLPTDSNAVNHPCRRPVLLYSHIIGGFTKENDIVCDPFIGSGTTAISCNDLKRDYIGFEISKEYCKIANKRIIDNKKQLKLF